MKKTLTAILLFIMTIVMAVAAIGCGGGESSSSETPDPGQSTGGDSSGEQEEKADAAAVADLKVNTKAVATFTAADGFEYRFVIDGEDVSVDGLNGKYDVSEYVSSSGKTHTVAVYSKENDKYKKSALSNEVKVKALDTENVNFAITADKKVTFNAIEGYEYYLSVNGTETKVTANQDVSALIAGGENTSTMVKLVIKGNVSGDTVTLDATAKEILNIVWHKKISDFAYTNGIITFSGELNYTYDLYTEGRLIKADVKSGEDVSDIISDAAEKELALYVKVNGNAANNAFVSAENEKSNEVVLKFLSAPEVTATVNGGVVSLAITDDNVGVENPTYELFIDGESAGAATNGQDISTLFAKKGETKISAKVSADGYVSSKIGKETSVTVPDYNRFHFVADNADNAEIGGLYGQKASIKANEEGVKVSSDITVDLTKANKKSAIIAINNPSEHPAGVEKITIDIVSASNSGKFIRMVATAGNNGYNAHIYGGFGENLDGSLRDKLDDGNYALVDANYGEIVDYNILWAALGLGRAEGDQGANDTWNYNQKRQLTLVYSEGKIGYYSPACKFVPFMDLNGVKEFNAEEFANAKLVFTFDKLISIEKAGYAKATHTLEVYGNGVDYTEEFMIDKEGFSITSADALKNSNGYIGIYLNVQPVGQDDIPAADWVAMDGSYKGAVTLNGVAYADMILKITDKNKLFLVTETSELNLIIANAVYLKAPLYIEIPAGSTFTYGEKEWKTSEKIAICSYYRNNEIKWQLCTHDGHEYSDDVAVKLGADVKRTKWYAFDVELKDASGNHLGLSETGELGITVKGEVTLNGNVIDPWFVTSDWNGYLLIKTSDGKVFENEADFNAAKAEGREYVLVLKAGTVFVFGGKNYVLAEDITYKLSLINGEYSWRGESSSQKDNIVAAKISAEQTDGYNYVKFEFAEKSNGFESENWDVFITVAEGAKFNDDALLLKRAGKGSNPFFYIDNTTGRTAVTGDMITFKAGKYYNANSELGIELDKDYVLVWDGTAWVLQA